MTEEEKLAEEYVKSVIDVNAFDWKIVREIVLAFIAGLKAGRPEWHTDPNDLPPMIQDERHISEKVWVNVENWGTEDGYYDYNKNFWIIRCRVVNLPIIAWCEIPQFKE